MNALIIVDMQKDFMPGGALPTKEADQIISLINELMEKFSLIVATKDWHPKDHIGFAANHPGKNQGEVIEIDGIQQILWPIHCVQETAGAEFADGLDLSKIKQIFFKGVDPKIDSYSTFFDNAHQRETGLGDFLKSQGVQDVTIVGVATEYCVLYSALDAVELGFRVTVVRDACKPINLRTNDEREALALMKKRGVHVVTSNEI